MEISKETQRIYIIINISFYLGVSVFLVCCFFNGWALLNDRGGLVYGDEKSFLDIAFPIITVWLALSYIALQALQIAEGLWLRFIFNTSIVVLLIGVYYLAAMFALVTSMMGVMLFVSVRDLIMVPLSFFQ